ncbi:MAG: DUF2807 domain-containing protein [Bacteroidetes bacterium]|nr:DUF2807 domain-containing protein [Bacteroidota bacterium]MBS1539280.1 DUF2807 domain-containing protein [Bacteroidota bacterium]
MRKINLIFVLIVVSLLLLSAASIAFAQATKKTLELPEFKSIYVNSNYTVYLKQTNKQEVSVEADPDIFALTKIFVENGVLMINVDRKPDNPNKSIWSKIDDIKLKAVMKVMVSVKNINELQVNSGGKIVSENSIAADYLSLAVAGSGGMDLDLKGNNIKTEVSGSGTIALKGYATANEIYISGSGSLNAFPCELETAKVKVSGSGNCEISVANSLTATVLGSGTIKHKGNTKEVTKKVYGSGSIDRAY